MAFTDDAAWIAEFMNEDLPLLAGFAPRERAELRSCFEPFCLPAGVKLFEEGDPADSLYVLVSGTLGVSVRDEHGRDRPLTRVFPPDTVGEMGLLSGAPRSSTITALRDCVLLQLSRDRFDTLLTRSPNAMGYFARLLAERLRRIGYGHEVPHAPVTFALVPVTEGVPLDTFVNGLQAEFETRLGLTTGVIDGSAAEADEGAFRLFERRFQRVFYVARSPEPHWRETCLRRADHILLVAAPGAPLLPMTRRMMASSSDWRRRDLVALHPQQSGALANLHSSVVRLGVDLRLNLRAGDSADLARAARCIGGRAFGLVLSGGGARGFAHVGVVRALREQGYEPDMIGGTSIGAIVGACIARNWSFDEITQRLRDAFVERSPMGDYTLPVVSLLRGRQIDRRLARHFGDLAIEDLWLPFFCTSANLTTGKVEVHTRGPLARALRASIAIPGLLPPVIGPEGVLVDGAVLNNLPADVMADQQRGVILAVDVARDRALQTRQPERVRRSILRTLLGIPAEAPSIATLLVRSATVSGAAQVSMTRLRASAVIQPPLADIGLRDWRAFERAVEIGYRHATQALQAGLLAKVG